MVKLICDKLIIFNFWVFKVVAYFVKYYFNITVMTSLNLLFHMGIGANGQYFVGGTLENKGNEDIYKGYIVIIPLTKDCYPLNPLLWPFDSVESGRRMEFKIPINGQLNGYKLDAIHAVDSYGNKIHVVDETTGVMAEKLPGYIEKCDISRRVK